MFTYFKRKKCYPVGKQIMTILYNKKLIHLFFFFETQFLLYFNLIAFKSICGIRKENVNLNIL